MELEGERVAFETARKDLSDSMVDNVKKKGKGKLENRERTGQLAYIRETIKKIGLSHARIPSLFNCLEGVMPGAGKFFKYITRTFDECGNHEAALTNEITEKLNIILEPLYKDLAKTKPRAYEVQAMEYTAAGDPQGVTMTVHFTRQDVFTMALNLGNEGNIQRLVDNSNGWNFMDGRTLTKEAIIKIIGQTLTADELQRVQAVWDLYKDLQREVEAKEIRKRGRAPAWVLPTPIALPSVDGQVVELKGGYYPIVYDRNSSAAGSKIEEAKGVLQEIKGVKGQAATWAGHLKDRADKVSMERPLTLTLRGAFEGFENTIHDLCWDEWVINTRRLFSERGQLSKTIVDYFGTDTLSAIKTWIKDTAAGKNTQSNMADGLAAFARKNISLVGIGFNLVTAAIQTVGITQSVVALGGKWTLSGVSEMFTRGPMGAYRFAASKSLLIQDRIRTQFREIAEIQRYTSSGYNKLYNGFARMAYTPVALVQMMVDLPTWIGAYNKALSEGKAEAEAVAVADRLLIEAQGSGRFQDLSGVERGNAWTQLFTVFYTFFNTTYNLCRVTASAKGGIARARDLLLLLVAQPVLETFVREALKVQPDDDDDEAYWDRMRKAALANTVNFNMSMLVLLREVASISNMFTGELIRYQGPTGIKMATDLIRWSELAAKQWSKEDEIDPAFIRQTITVFAEISKTPIPVVPINRYLRGKEAIDKGDTDDWKAYLFGYSKK